VAEVRPDSMMQDGLISVGRRAWAWVGIFVISAMAYALFAGLSGLVIPLVVASVIGALFVPLVGRLAGFLPRKAAAGIVLLGLLMVGFGAVAVAINGVVDQGPEIRQQLASGLDSIRELLDGLGIDSPTGEDAVESGEAALPDALPGITSALGSIFSSAGAFLAGTAVALFFLFYLLADWRTMTGWVGSHLGVPDELGDGAVEDAVWSVRRYFYALTVTSLVTAVVIGLTAAVVGVPLAFSIALVTFITSYVPYVGAFVSGAFAVLIALGAGGISDALIILAVILVVQMVIQPILQNRMTASELDIHPVVSFGSTIVGGVFAGVLGAMLSAPLVAMIIKIRNRVKHYEEHEARAATAGENTDAPVASEPSLLGPSPSEAFLGQQSHSDEQGNTD